jgi:nucleoside 2-deoxyribosyltransferase
MTNRVFFGCNYNDKSIKNQFDNMKKRIEAKLPISCVIIDKRTTKTADDIWNDIKTEIEKSDLCVFDVSGFRPNVVLELGYALAVKNNNQIIITFRQRRQKGKSPEWLLSDISHLQRHQYSNVSSLEELIRSQIQQIEYIKQFKAFKSRMSKVE